MDKKTITTAFQDFLGVEPIRGTVVEPEKCVNFWYRGDSLLYELFIHFDKQQLLISGDFNKPFCYRSIFEVSARFDRVVLEKDHKGEFGKHRLLLFKGEGDIRETQKLEILRWPNRELSVWPGTVG